MPKGFISSNINPNILINPVLGKISIIENDPSASLKKVDLVTSSSIGIKLDALNGAISALFKPGAPTQLACDAIIYDDSHDEARLLFCELKSSAHPGNIAKAIDQFKSAHCCSKYVKNALGIIGGKKLPSVLKIRYVIFVHNKVLMYGSTTSGTIDDNYVDIRSGYRGRSCDLPFKRLVTCGGAVYMSEFFR